MSQYHYCNNGVPTDNCMAVQKLFTAFRTWTGNSLRIQLIVPEITKGRAAFTVSASVA